MAHTAAVPGPSRYCHPPQQGQERTLVSSKVQSCLEERDAIRQRVDEALQAKDQVRGQLLWDRGCLSCPCAFGGASVSLPISGDEDLPGEENLNVKSKKCCVMMLPGCFFGTFCVPLEAEVLG